MILPRFLKNSSYVQNRLIFSGLIDGHIRQEATLTSDTRMTRHLLAAGDCTIEFYSCSSLFLVVCEIFAYAPYYIDSTTSDRY